jgi:hypothetical protein
MFIAALSTILKLRKQPRGPTIDEWIKKLRNYDYIYIYTYMIHHVVLRYMDAVQLEDIMLSEVIQV